MTLVLVALGAFLAGAGATAITARYFFLMGWEMAHDDRRLEPGAVGALPSQTDATGPIPRVGESSGRHALPDWPTAEDTQRLSAVSDEDRAWIASDTRHARTEDARDRYEETHP